MTTRRLSPRPDAPRGRGLSFTTASELLVGDERGAPAPVPWAKYKHDSQKEWARLLDAGPAEQNLQSFLEQNPAFVPGARTPGGPSGQGPWQCMLVSQPRLTGLSTKIPDFMWIAYHSAEWFPTLVEFERPNMRIFRRDGVPTAEFTRARNQLGQWRTWFATPSNVQTLIAEYGIPTDVTLGRLVKPHFILVYGRRAEFQNNHETSKLRGSQLPAADEELMSFDRLQPDEWLESAFTVKPVGSCRFLVIGVMPTLRFDRSQFADIKHVVGFEECIGNDRRISSERRKYLVQLVSGKSNQ